MITENKIKFGLPGETVSKINSVFARFAEIEEAILYGSRAKGNYKPGSDIDIVLAGETLNLHILNRIGLALDELFLPYTFDLSIYRQISNSDLIAHIKRAGKILYRKS